MRRIFILVICLITLTDGTSSADATDPGPTLNETDAWLQDRLPKTAISGKEVTWTVFATYAAYGCKLAIRTRTKVSGTRPQKTSLGYVLSFRPSPGNTFNEVDSSNVGSVVTSTSIIDFSEISPVGVTLSLLRSNASNDLPPINVAPNLMAFTFKDERVALRARLAMLHAIRLCSSKHEAF